MGSTDFERFRPGCNLGGLERAACISRLNICELLLGRRDGSGNRAF